MAFLKKNVDTDSQNTNDIIKNLLLDNFQEGLVVADEFGNIIFSNRLGNSIMEKGLFGPIDIISRNSKEFDFEGRSYEVKYTRITENSGVKGTLASFCDKMGKTAADNEIAKLKQELEKANHFKAAFLANMSHEIRTPIHAIIGFSELINKQEVPESVKEQVNLIKDSSYSLLAIINDVLDLSKIVYGNMELVCSNYYLSYVIRDIDANFSMLASRKGLKFEIHLDDNIPSNIYGDKIRIRGTLFNLLNNAIKFTKEGRVDLYIHVVEKKNDIVTLQFVVKDTGIGIKKENLERIFESFSKFDIDNNYAIEGRGLGLSIAKGYMDLMDGDISVKSEYGVGSVFTVTVNQKIVDDSPIDMNIVNARKRKANYNLYINDYNVLVVDDNPVNLTVAEGLAKSYGIAVDKASGGQKAFDMCMVKKYDMILMDQMMPEMDGIMAMRQIRKISEFYEKECKIIVLTADAMSGVRERLMGIGFDEYLCKPLEMHRLEATLRQFVPSDKIGEKPNNNDSIEVNKTSDAISNKKKEDKKDEVVHDLSNKIGIQADILEKKIEDCGGSVFDYEQLCETAYKYYDRRVEKIEESLNLGDYDRLSTAIHSLKSSLSSLGALDMAAKAKDIENAIISGERDGIEDNTNRLMLEYKDFIKKIEEHVLKINKDLSEEESAPVGEEWTKEEIVKVIKRMVDLSEAFDFAALFELLSDIQNMEMGQKTREIFSSLEQKLNDMDLDAFNKQLGENL